MQLDDRYTKRAAWSIEELEGISTLCGSSGMWIIKCILDTVIGSCRESVSKGSFGGFLRYVFCGDNSNRGYFCVLFWWDWLIAVNQCEESTSNDREGGFQWR